MKHKIEIIFDESANSVEAGLRQNWVDGEDATAEVNLSCGAGCGSPFMVFSRTDKKTKETKYAVADIRPLVHAMEKALRVSR